MTHVTTHQSNFYHLVQLKTLVSKLWDATVLHRGTTNTVTGEIWFNFYIASLNDDEKKKIQNHKASNTYKFGDKNFLLMVGNQNMMLDAHIVASNILLLLFGESMKKSKNSRF